MAATPVTGIGPARRRVREGFYSFKRGSSVSSEQPSPDRPPTPVPRDTLLESVRPYLRASGNGAPPPADADVERALLRIQRLETLGRLTSEIAHDFSNLMTLVIGYGELLASNTPENLPGRTYLDQMRSAADRAAELTRQLLDFCLMTSEPRTGPVDLSALVRAAGSMLGRLLQRTIALDVDAARAANVQADVRDVEQLVVNLVLNACDATSSSRGRVDVSVTPVHLDAAPPQAVGTVLPGEFVRLRVRDTGCGMDDATLGRLFKPFFTTKPFGTGLGLAVVARIVRQNRAAMTVQTDPASGTTFDVYFPAAG
jgi:two-component system cell cycle sensor histidine kinase/response regulator CckA